MALPTKDFESNLNTWYSSGKNYGYYRCLFSEEGDKVIQIESTINKYGEDFCCLKHIITLDTYGPIDNAIVVQCETEEQVIQSGLNLWNSSRYNDRL